MAKKENPVKLGDIGLLLLVVIGFAISNSSAIAKDLLSLVVWFEITDENIRIIRALALIVGFISLIVEIYSMLSRWQKSFDRVIEDINEAKREMNNKKSELEDQYRIIKDAVTANGNQETQLSVVAPAGKWLQTSSWSEIVKKMGNMLQLHKWGEIPSLSELNYLIEFDGDVDMKSMSSSQEVTDSSQFVAVNYLQWHSFEWEENTPRRASLSSIISQLFSIYVVMPYEDFASVQRQISPNGECAPVYPVNRKMISRWIELMDATDGDQDTPNNRSICVKELRKIKWLSSCPRNLLVDLIDSTDAFSAVAGEKLQDNDKPLSRGEDVLEPAFSVKFFFFENGAFDVCKVRYLTLFDQKTGEMLDSVKSILAQHLNDSVIEEMFNKYERRIMGCYVPVPEDVDILKRKCIQLQNIEYWNNLKIKLLYSWSYLHVRAIRSPGVNYTNDSWSFLVSSVGRLSKAVFRGKSKIRFQDENAVVPYTMSSSEKLPALKGNHEVIFEPGDLETSPSDAFHINWNFDEPNPEVNRLEEENKKLKEENDRLQEEKAQPGGAQSSNPPAEVENLTISNRAS